MVKLGEIDNLLQTVMFTLYGKINCFFFFRIFVWKKYFFSLFWILKGNQYEPREEHLLLSMFKQVLQKEFEEGLKKKLFDFLKC